MPTHLPFVRESGHGPAVVCLHSNASNSGQWRGLMEQLSGSHRVLAPDSYGSGQSPAWESDRPLRLHDEVDLIEPVLTDADASFSLVGHSYGAAVALLAALRYPERVRSLVVYEPTLFSLVDAQSPPPNGVDGIRNAVNASMKALDAGNPDTAAGHFIDFWMGAGSWVATPAQRKPAIAEAITNMPHWFHALFNETTALGAFAALDVPVLYMVGEESSESAHAVSRVLLPVLKRAEVIRLPGLGHMAPITHPEIVNAQIVRFLRRAQP